MSERDLSYCHYVLSVLYSLLKRPTLTIEHATLSKNLRKKWGLSQTDLDHHSTLRLGLEPPEEEPEEDRELDR